MMCLLYEEKETFVNVSLFEFCHTIRVASYAKHFGEVLKIQGNELELLYQLSLYHDIGKERIPNSILEKLGKLTKEELKLIYNHSIFSENLVKKISHLKKYAYVVRSHHEKWDGTGYPDGLKGYEIPYYARIIAIVEVYDALTSKRIYKDKVYTQNEALNILIQGMNKHFDPHLVKIFCENVAKITKVVPD